MNREELIQQIIKICESGVETDVDQIGYLDTEQVEPLIRKLLSDSLPHNCEICNFSFFDRDNEPRQPDDLKVCHYCYEQAKDKAR
jgi:hypothetical protein